MGRVFVIELEGRTYKCKFCKIQLALADDLVSQAFHCRRGKAYLFNKAVNITLGASEERLMLSGMHTVADIYCCCCGQIVGWKYVLLYRFLPLPFMRLSGFLHHLYLLTFMHVYPLCLAYVYMYFFIDIDRPFGKKYDSTWFLGLMSVIVDWVS